VQVVDGHRALAGPLPSPALALGNFDGVHLGHRALLDAAVAAARRLNGVAAVYTFDPHPAKVLAPDLAPRAITTRDRKLELLADRGIDVCVVETFDRQLASLPPEAFVDDVLVSRLGVRHVVVGFDFTFGRHRSGSADALRRLGEGRGFTVEVIEPVTIEGIVASSTRVRNFVSDGNMGGARLLLGRDFEVDGRVVRGAARGRELGFPTANVDPITELLPASGIYAGRLRAIDGVGDQAWRPAAISLGTNPTFTDADRLSLEAHVLDFQADIFDRRVRVAFVQRLRGEKRFGTRDELVSQIQRDVAQTRAILGLAG
jgi:riboflavin kinase/FMN adenylyltransferase